MERIKDIVAQFISTENYSLSPITDGLINTTYLLEDKDNKEKFILQKINHNVFRQPEIIINNHVMINKLLRSNNYQFQIVEPVPSLTHELLVKDADGEPWRMLNFIENSITFVTVPLYRQLLKQPKPLVIFSKPSILKSCLLLKIPFQVFSILKKDYRL